MDAATRRFVRERAGERCEYCRFHQRNSELLHHIEHVVARQHGGFDDADNLALACHRCNMRSKSYRTLNSVPWTFSKIAQQALGPNAGTDRRFVARHGIQDVFLLPVRTAAKTLSPHPTRWGFVSPRIVTEVKHRKGTMGAPDVRAFAGGLRNQDNGLYVSTGGFTREVRYEADRANHPLTLMDSIDLGKAIVENYDLMDRETRTLLPFKKIYWPV